MESRTSANLPVRQMKHTRRRSAILLGERHTTLLSRLVAKVIDMVVVVAVFFLGDALWPPAGLVLALVFCAAQDAWAEGQSVGKRIMGLRVTDDRTGQICSFRASTVRNIPFLLAVLFIGVPLFWALAALIAVPLVCFETFVLVSVESGIRLGDVMANTVVIEYDESRPPVFHQNGAMS